jgi:hypothetical protein
MHVGQPSHTKTPSILFSLGRCFFLLTIIHDYYYHFLNGIHCIYYVETCALIILFIILIIITSIQLYLQLFHFNYYLFFQARIKRLSRSSLIQTTVGTDVIIIISSSSSSDSISIIQL